MSNDYKTLADVQPGGRVRLGDQRSDLVPGIVRCAKCHFQLARSNLNMHSGTMTAGDSKTEPCPNGCGPLWPVTWETWAREGWAEAERLHLENAALSARQPVGEPVGHLYRVVVSEAGASRPWVGRGIVFEPGPPPHEGVRRNIQYMSVYDRPQTAQVVDLGQFRVLAEFGEEFAFSAEKQPQSRVIYAQARRLLALIDGKAVGK
jgi:hypothetical protein